MSDIRLLSLFDILGPIMIGPSSNHVAGAVRIGRIARMIFGQEPSEVVLKFYGPLAETYKGQKSDVAIIAGLLQMDVDDQRIPKSLEIAHKKKIKIIVHTKALSQKDPNTMEMLIKNKSFSLEIEGISPGGGEILIHRIGEFCVHIQGNNDALILIFSEKKKDYILKMINKMFSENLQKIESVKSKSKILLYIYLHHTLNDTDLIKLNNIENLEFIRIINCLYPYKLRNNNPLFRTTTEMLKFLEKQNIALPEAIIKYESKRSGLSEKEIRDMFKKIWVVMNETNKKGLKGVQRPFDSIVGNDSKKIYKVYNEGKNITGEVISLAVSRALASMEVNSVMGRIVAAPTGGSSGVIPGVIITMAEKLKSDEKEVINALLVAAMIGVLIANTASLSGSAGGCQSEVGVASSMAAGALVQLAGGNPQQVVNASALALKNLLGLICDTVANSIEVPCIKRNVVGVVNALATAEMALADIKSVIPLDEVIVALKNVQDLMPLALRNTQKGGLSITKTAKKLKREWRKNIKSMM
jgi:L-serine dehydratase